MNVDRLNQLITVLKDIPDEKFDMEHWQNEPEDSTNCKTTACAGGWAASHLPFIKQGLSLESIDHVAVPHYNNKLGFHALADFFGITYGTSEYLFDPECYSDLAIEPEDIDPSDVIDRINDLMGRKTYEPPTP